MNKTEERRMIDITVSEFKELMNSFGFTAKNETHTKKYVYGIVGIMELFGISYQTASRLKNGKIKGAVYQNGKTIIVDVDKAMELFNS